jgi:hypothetical protein
MDSMKFAVEAILQKRTPESTVTVPVPLHSELKRGTLMSIIRQSGIPRQIFEVENLGGSGHQT